MAGSSNFGGKKAAPFTSAKKTTGKKSVKRKVTSAKTAKGTAKKAGGGLAAYNAARKAKKGK